MYPLHSVIIIYYGPRNVQLVLSIQTIECNLNWLDVIATVSFFLNLKQSHNIYNQIYINRVNDIFSDHMYIQILP